MNSPKIKGRNSHNHACSNISIFTFIFRIKLRRIISFYGMKFPLLIHFKKNSVAHTNVNLRLVLKRTLFTISIYATYWKDKFFLTSFTRKYSASQIVRKRREKCAFLQKSIFKKISFDV